MRFGTPPRWPSVKIPDFLPFSTLPKRLRNTLFSLLFCFGLIAAWYATMGNHDLPPDTHITYEAAGAFRLDIDAEGHVRLADRHGTYSYKISQFAVRRIVRTFQQVDFFGLNIRAYDGTSAACQLTLTEGHQKSAIRHNCETQVVELRKPVQALDQVTRFRRVLKDDKAVMSDYGVKFTRDTQSLSQ